MNRRILFLLAPLALSVATSRAQEAGGTTTSDTTTANGTTTTTTTGAAVTVTATTKPAPVQYGQGILFPYYLLDGALAGRVDENGNVDYSALKDNVDLKNFVGAVATADLARFPVFQNEPTEDELKINRKAKPRPDRSAELVFWINAYNATVLKTLSDAYPINSPDEIKNLDALKHRVAGEDLTFAAMRERIAKLDRRALFSITDGTHGGPLLNPKAYRWADINALLEISAQTFISDPAKVSVLQIDNRVEIPVYLTQVNDYFLDKQIAGGAERRKLNGVRFVLASYAKGPNRSYFNTADYRLVVRQPDRRLNIKTTTVRTLQ